MTISMGEGVRTVQRDIASFWYLTVVSITHLQRSANVACSGLRMGQSAHVHVVRGEYEEKNALPSPCYASLTVAQGDVHNEVTLAWRLTSMAAAG